MDNQTIYNVLEIIRGTTVDGPGFRTSIYLAGCSHACEGCQNPQSHNPQAGIKMSLREIMEIVKEEDFNVSISGGDPLFHPEKLRTLITTLKKNRRNVWVYTGYTWNEIISNPVLLNAVRGADVLVDGRFNLALRDPDLPFKGSSNQQIIDIKKSLLLNEIILYT